MVTDRDRRILAHCPELPDDMAEAFDSMKLAVLRNRIDGWREMSQDDLYALIGILFELSREPE